MDATNASVQTSKPVRSSARQSRSLISAMLSGKNDLSVELKKRVIDPSAVETYISSFESIAVPKSRVIANVAKMFYKSATGQDVKMKVLGTDTSSMFNEQAKSCKLDSSSTIVSKKITQIPSVPHMASRAELTMQITMALLADPNWLLRIGLTKRIDNPTELMTRLKPAKDALMDTPFSRMDQAAFDYITTELVRVNQEPIEYVELIDLVDLVAGSSALDETSDEEYQGAIFELAKDIYRDATMISRFKRESGFKRLCPSPIELNRILFFKKLLPAIDTYYMTDKMDGLHAVLVIDEVFKTHGRKKNCIGTNIYAVSDKIYDVSSGDIRQAKNTFVEHTVLDVEMMVDAGSNITFHCFDIIAMKSRRVVGLPFHKRFEHFGAADALLDKYDLGGVKEFIKLSKSEYCAQITEFYNKPRPYKIDGIIFTPAGMFYKDAVKLRKSRFDRVLNTGYTDTISFKWKPLEQLTIDFYIMDYPKQKGHYALCSGVDIATFNKLKMSFFDGYKAPDSPNAFQYFPIQFETYDGEFEFVWKPSSADTQVIASAIGDDASIVGMVGEYQLADRNGILAKPRLLRLRTDRTGDIARGEYYGNALRYSELIWHSIKYPLLIETMCGSASNAYFAADDTDGWYRASRGFNSFVKSYLMEMYLPAGQNSRLMDIAAGKGQDLARTIDLGYSEVVALDKDTDALTELLERKYNLRVKTKHSSAAVHIKKIDLEDSAADTIKALKLAGDSADSMMINFALHYICHSALPNKSEPLVEFAKLCQFYLKPRGRVMITTFNGEDVFNRLATENEWSVSENNRLKYSIRKGYASDTLTNLDQSIDVLLPFSAGEYYQEFLVNYGYVQAVFEQHGLGLITSDSFESLLRTFRKQNMRGYREMTAGDKEYVSLYGYMIFEKLE